MKNKLFLDYETRARVSVKDAGAVAYAKQAEVIAAAYAFDNGPVKLWKALEEPMPADLKRGLKSKKYTIIAHNSFFEWAITNFTLKIELPFERTFCTAALCRSAGLPGALAWAGNVLKIEVKKDMIGRAAMLKLSKPRTKKDPRYYEPDERPELFEQLYKYVDIDVVVSRRYFDELYPVFGFPERRLWLLDQKINAHGIPADRKLLAHFMAQNQKINAEIQKQAIKLSPQKSEKFLKSIKQLREATGLHSFTKQAVIDALKLKLPAKTRRTLQLRQAASKSSIAKLRRIKLRTDEDGYLKDSLIFHGAHTGRFKSAGAQLHNLPRALFKHEEILKNLWCDFWKKYKFEAPNFISSAIRYLFYSPKGFNVGDFAAIEARVLSYLAGDQEAVEEYRAGVDRYKILAGHVFHVKPEAIKSKTDWRRDLGKKGVLGCGYGMGWSKFKVTCYNEGLSISDELSQKTVNTYRRKNPKVVKFWRNCEKAWRMALKRKGSVQKVGLIKFRYNGQFMQIRLPSGRKLTYWHPSETRSGDLYYIGVNKNGMPTRVYIYGGKIVENIVQGVARDIMAEAMLDLDEAAFNLVLTVHDEVLAEGGPQQKFKKLLAVVPEWLPGYPQDVEVWKEKRYRK